MAHDTPVTILLIDDEPSFVRALACLLRRNGATVDIAANGNQALAQLQARRYDVILCDLRMPELDGPTFYAILTSQYPCLCQRVVFMTGDTLGVASLAFLEQCGQPWVAKPCTAAAVRGAIAHVLRATAPPQARPMVG
jgi:CheY-like chemotaxis protein